MSALLSLLLPDRCHSRASNRERSERALNEPSRDCASWPVVPEGADAPERVLDGGRPAGGAGTPAEAAKTMAGTSLKRMRRLEQARESSCRWWKRSHRSTPIAAAISRATLTPADDRGAGERPAPPRHPSISPRRRHPHPSFAASQPSRSSSHSHTAHASAIQKLGSRPEAWTSEGLRES